MTIRRGRGGRAVAAAADGGTRQATGRDPAAGSGGADDPRASHDTALRLPAPGRAEQECLDIADAVAPVAARAHAQERQFAAVADALHGVGVDVEEVGDFSCRQEWPDLRPDER
jgi:hypothetical protein